MLPSPFLAPTQGGGPRAPPQPYRVLRPGGVSPWSPCILAASSQGGCSQAQVRGAAAAEVSASPSRSHIPASEAGPGCFRRWKPHRRASGPLWSLRRDPCGESKKQEPLS